MREDTPAGKSPFVQYNEVQNDILWETSWDLELLLG
jgi:hypothetical protein